MGSTDVTVERAAGNVAHLERLLAAFGGSLAGWTLDPEVSEQNGNDLGAVSCACGHRPLRYLFTWRKAGRVVITGSVCVETAPGITQELLQAMAAGLARLKEQQAAERARARLVAQDAEVALLLTNLDAAIEQKLGPACRRWYGGDYAPPRVYAARWRRRNCRAEMARAQRLKTKAGCLRVLRALLAGLENEEVY